MASSAKNKDPSATVLDLIRPGVEDTALTTHDVSSASVFITSTPKFGNFAQQTIAGVFSGTAEFGGHAVFSILPLGDYIAWITIEIELGTWFADNVAHFVRRGAYGGYTYNSPAWYYTNNLAAALIERVWIEADGIEIDEVTGEWIDVWSRLFLTPSRAYSLRRDCMGWVPNDELFAPIQTNLFPTEDGRIVIPIPMWFARHAREALPLSSAKEGILTLHVRFRRFAECVRSDTGTRSSVTDTPLNKTFQFTDTRFSFNNTLSIVAGSVPPAFKSCRALINYVLVDGDERTELLHAPVVRPCQPLQVFPFGTPLRHAIASTTDNVRVSLPLEMNGPIEELVWVLRRTAVNQNNDWTNYGAYVESELMAGAVQRPLLRSAIVQVNSVPWVTGDEVFFRSRDAGPHSGSSDAASAYIYHYSFAPNPESVIPDQSVNASKVDVRLLLDVRVPNTSMTDKSWEVIVFALTRNWVRYQNGLMEMLFSAV